MEHLGISGEQDRRWHKAQEAGPGESGTEPTPEGDPVNCFAIGGGFLEYCLTVFARPYTTTVKGFPSAMSGVGEPFGRATQGFLSGGQTCTKQGAREAAAFLDWGPFRPVRG